VIKDGTVCHNANLAHADLTGAPLAYADLRGSTLQGANLTGARLHNAKLSGTNFAHANLSNVGAHDAHISSSILNHANLNGADLLAAHLHGSQLDSADLSNARLELLMAGEANFAHAKLHDTKVNEAQLEGSNFFGAHLRNANFRLADLENASFVGAYFSNTAFQSATIRNTKVLPSTIAHDPTARDAFFRRVYTHVNAYGSNGSCSGSSSSASCQGRNDDPNATPPFTGEVRFGWDQRHDHYDFRIADTFGHQLSGKASGNLGALDVTSVSGFTNLQGTGAIHAAPGEVGGALALHVGYHSALSRSGYVLNARGWLQRAIHGNL
jgi:uncharacterized protein YjbI with pentapeptide repeats